MSLEEATLLDEIAEGQGRAPQAPPPSRARGRFGFALGLAGAFGELPFDRLQDSLDAPEWSGSLGYRWAASAIFDLRIAVNGTYMSSPWKWLSRYSITEPEAYYDISLFSVGAELVPRAHFTRSSHDFVGVGPRAAFRHLSAAVYTNVPGSPPEGRESKQTANDLLVQGLFELGVEIGRERHVEATIRFAAGGSTSALFAGSFGMTLGYMF